jgi:hypothetical protein
MYFMNGKTVWKFCPILLFITFLLLFSPASLAESKAFHEDYTAIDYAAKSVLMLEIYDKNEELIATGSGFVIFDNLTMVTNCHVLDGAYYMIAYSDDGFHYDIDKVIAVDKDKDIAILGFESPTNLAPLEYVEKAELLRGQPVVAIGSPKGIKNTVSIGNISTIVADQTYNVIQFTAPISHGSSGGALFNDEGKVVGITFASLEEGQNLNFAIGIDEAVLLYSKRNDQPIYLDEYAETGNGNTSSAEGTPQPTASPTPAVQPTAIPISKISDLTAKQIGPNTVEINWKEDSAGEFTYYVNFQCDSNLFWIENQTTTTSFKAENLAPGYEHTFYVSTDKDDFTNSLLITIKVNEADNYTTSNFKAKSLSICYCNAGENIIQAKRTKVKSIKSIDLKNAGILRDYIAVITFSKSESLENSPLKTMIELILPNGHVYTQAFEGEMVKDRLSNVPLPLNINSVLQECLVYDKDFPVGTYEVRVLFNGQLAAKTNFDVK